MLGRRYCIRFNVLTLFVTFTVLTFGGVALTEATSFTLSRVSSSERSLTGYIALRGTELISQKNAQQLFVPASVLKLVVTAAALHYLGPDHRRVTTLAGTGPVREGVLQGDLVLQADGDPTWNRRFFPRDPRAPLRQLARQLREAGVRRVLGDLVVDTSRFSGPKHPLSRPVSEQMLWYGAAPSAVAVDENWMWISIAPGKRPGDPAEIRGVPGLFKVLNLTRTVGPEHKGHGSIGFYPGPDGRTLVVHGEYPSNEPRYGIKASKRSLDTA
jgi:D-alanyl-D-alanine carboxypeptidase/D-alanyl-D-alanine-endopeptidase (penicillin-binding protein 4)